MNPQIFLVVAVVIVMGWFAFGVIWNLRRGDALLKWMQDGLPDIGERTTFRWLGTSVADLEIAHARKPFRNLKTLLVLKPRDVFWMTLLALFQGREDLVIFRAQLTTPPVVDLELLDPKSWSGRDAQKKLEERKWQSKPYRELQLWAPAGLLDLAATSLDRFATPMQDFSARYARFSLRRDTPNLELHVPFPDPHKLGSVSWFAALRRLAQAVAERE